MIDHTPLPKRLFLPRYWPTWSALAVAWLLVRLPFRWMLRAGAVLGLIFMRAAPRRRHIARVNIGLCFPDLDPARRERLLRDHFRALGIGLLETAMAWWLPERRLAALIRSVEGLHHLREAVARGAGVIVLSGHFTMAELGARLLNHFVRVRPMYRVPENPVLHAVMLRRARVYFDAMIAREDTRAMLKALREGHAVWYAPDQNYGHKNSVFAAFFGVPAATNTATLRFARMTGAAVIPYFLRRLPDGSGYRLELQAPLAAFPSGDELRDTERTNALLEAAVRAAPEQYLWVHRRFKDRPRGQRDFYDPSVSW